MPDPNVEAFKAQSSVIIQRLRFRKTLGAKLQTSPTGPAAADSMDFIEAGQILSALRTIMDASMCKQANRNNLNMATGGVHWA